MPRKAMLAGVVFTGLLLSGCEWCGNCKSFCDRGAGSYSTSTPSTTAGNRIVSTQTPSSVAANPSTNQKSGSDLASQRPGVVPAKGDSFGVGSGGRPYDPNVEQANYPSDTSSLARPSTRKATRNLTPDSDSPPPPDDPTTTVAPADAGPTLQPPTRTPGVRPQY